MSLESLPTELLQRIVCNVNIFLKEEEDFFYGFSHERARPARDFKCINVSNWLLERFALVNKRIAEVSKFKLHEEIKLDLLNTLTEDQPGLYEVLELFYRQLQEKPYLASQIM